MKDKKKIDIVLVEDDYLVAEMIRYTVQQLGHQIIFTASNGKEGVEKVCLLKPDIVLMDVEMPEMDGIQAAQIINETCSTPIVIITAYDSEELLNKAAKAGISSYLTKPVDPQTLDKVLTVAMARHKDMMELRRMNEALIKSEKEKTLLMKESHHRTKNNLAIVASILNLYGNDMHNPEDADILEEVRLRITTLAQLHDLLYHNDTISEIDISLYGKQIIESLISGYSMSVRSADRKFRRPPPRTTSKPSP